MIGVVRPYSWTGRLSCLRTLCATPVEPTRLYALNVALLAEQIAPGEGPGRRHPLAVILSTVLAGLLSWAKDLRGIGQWAKSPDGDVDRTVGLAGWQPDRSRIRQILARLDCELLYCVFDTSEAKPKF